MCEQPLEVLDYNTISIDSSTDQIRLLSFRQPAEPNGQVRCNFEVFSSQEAPEYAAFRYEWGVGDRSTPLTWNDDSTCVKVTPSLADALSYLATYQSSHFLRNRHQYVWADAICINQADLDERSC